MNNYTNTITVPQVPLLGNRCGHDPRFLRKFVRHGKRTWHVIEETLRRLSSCMSDRFHEAHSLMFHVERGRMKRSERREAELLRLLPALISTVNLSTMQCGYFNGPTFVNYQYKDFAKFTGLSMSRIRNHMRGLKQLGIVVVRTVVDDMKRHVKTVIEVKQRIFDMLGMLKQLEMDCAKSRRNREKEEKRLAAQRKLNTPTRTTGFIKKGVKALRVLLSPDRPKKVELPDKKPPAAACRSPEDNRRIAQLAYVLIKEGVAASEAYLKACARLGFPPPR